MSSDRIGAPSGCCVLYQDRGEPLCCSGAQTEPRLAHHHDVTFHCERSSAPALARRDQVKSTTSGANSSTWGTRISRRAARQPRSTG